MDNKTKNISKYLLWSAVAVVLLWLCLRSVDWNEFLSALKMCKWVYVVLAFLAGAFLIYLRGIRWHMLMKPLDPSIRKVDVFNAYGIGYLTNIVLPRAGEVVKIGCVVKRSKLSWDTTIGTYVAEKAIDLLASSFFIVAFAIGAWGQLGNIISVSGKMTILWILLALAVLGVVIVWLSYVYKDKGALWGKLWGFIEGMWKGLVSIRHIDKPWLFTLYTIVIWFLEWFTSAAMVWALIDIEPFNVLDTSDALYLMVAGIIASVIPVPGGFGAYHGAVATVMYALYGIPMGTGMIYATLNHETQVLAQLVVGIWNYIHENFLRDASKNKT